MRKEIVIDEKSMMAIYHKDCAVLTMFVVGLWCVLLPVLFSVIGLTEDPIAKGFLLAAAGIGGLGLSAAIFAVFLHIRKNRGQIYREELENQKLAS